MCRSGSLEFSKLELPTTGKIEDLSTPGACDPPRVLH